LNGGSEMNDTKILEQKIIEINEIIMDYKKQLETSKEKIEQINIKNNGLKLLKMKKSPIQNVAMYVLGVGMLSMIPLSMPHFTTAFERVAVTGLTLTMTLPPMAVFASETKSRNKRLKENPYYDSFKNLSKKECSKKQQELKLEKDEEQKNIEKLEKCLEEEQEKLSDLILKMSDNKKEQETIGKELEKMFLHYLDEANYKDINLENNTVDTVKIKMKTR